MHDRIIGALETCCRQGEMLRIQNRHVDWAQHQIVIPGREREGLGEPAHSVRPPRAAGSDPEAAGKPWARRVRLRLSGRGIPGQLQDRLGVSPAARPRPRHEARKARCTRRSREAPTDRPALARPASRRRLPAPGDGVDIRGDSVDARSLRHQDHAAIPQHHGRRSAEGADWCLGTAAAVEGSRA